MRQLAVGSSCLLGALFIALVFAVMPARASLSASWYHTFSGEDRSCWLIGPFEEAGETAEKCESSGAAGYVAEHMINDANDTENYKQLRSGDYCSYAGLGDTINQPVGTRGLFADLSASPLSNYQEGDGHLNVCASWESPAVFTYYKELCPSGPTTICYFGLKSEANEGRGCEPEVERCECNHNGFDCECTGFHESCWACVLDDCETLTRVDFNTERECISYEPWPEREYIGCEADEVGSAEPLSWGFDLENGIEGGDECPKSCAMQHYVSLAGQGLNDHPWASYLGEPVLTVENTIKPLQVYPSGAKAWGYLCPVLEEAGGEKHIIELCFEQWRASGDGTEWKTEHAEACTEPAGLNHTVSRVVALFEPKTQFATERAGSANTEVYSNDTEKPFGASVSGSNLENIVKAANEHCAKKSSLAPSEWALIGISSGIEVLEAAYNTHVTAEEHDLNVDTEYEQHPLEVTSENATEITSEQATVSAAVNPYGLSSSYTVEYETPEHLKTTSPDYVGEKGFIAVPVSVKLTELLPGTVYHYRVGLQAYREERYTAYGPWETFTTPAKQPVVETEAPLTLTETSATLKASVTPGGADVSECYFEYGTTTSYGKSVACSSLPGSGEYPIAVSATPSSLAKSTVYHFRIVATNSVGTSYGADATFRTLPYPPVVVTKEASAVTHTTATLNATVNPNKGTVSACKFEFGTTTSYGKSASCSSLPGSGESPVAVSAVVSGLAESTIYHFRIAATNPVETSYGADQTLMTLPRAPSVVTEANSLLTETSVTLNATVNPEAAPVSGCRFEYGTSPSLGSSVSCTPMPGSGESPVAVSAAVSGLHGSTTYYERIGATNSIGTGYSSTTSFTTPAASCEGSNVEGLGASLQTLAQRVWQTGFRFSSDTYACSGTQGDKQTPSVTYSAEPEERLRDGFEAWNTLPYTLGQYGFIGTDSPVNESERDALEAKGTTVSGGKVLTIPVLEEAIAVVINLPEGCLAESTVAKHRLVLKQETLEGIFAGTVTEWSQINDYGDKIVQNTAKGSPTCSPDTPIKTVVPDDNTNATHIFKRFLDWSHVLPLATPSGSFTWNELSERKSSTLWPNGVGDVRAPPGESRESIEVAYTPSSIGYTGLAEARWWAFAPGENHQRFWAEVESKPGVYADPSTDKDVEKIASANCKATIYSNGVQSFPPPSVGSAWNYVTADHYSASYAICGLTYDLTLANYAAFGGGADVEVGEAETVHDYLSYVLDAHGGQAEIVNHDYLPLPSNVRQKSLEGLPLITWAKE